MNKYENAAMLSTVGELIHAHKDTNKIPMHDALEFVDALEAHGLRIVYLREIQTIVDGAKALHTVSTAAGMREI